MSPVSTSLHLTCLLKMDLSSGAECKSSNVNLKDILGRSDFVENSRMKYCIAIVSSSI